MSSESRKQRYIVVRNSQTGFRKFKVTLDNGVDFTQKENRNNFIDDVPGTQKGFAFCQDGSKWIIYFQTDEFYTMPYMKEQLEDHENIKIETVTQFSELRNYETIIQSGDTLTQRNRNYDVNKRKEINKKYRERARAKAKEKKEQVPVPVVENKPENAERSELREKLLKFLDLI